MFFYWKKWYIRRANHLNYQREIKEKCLNEQLSRMDDL